MNRKQLLGLGLAVSVLAAVCVIGTPTAAHADAAAPTLRTFNVTQSSGTSTINANAPSGARAGDLLVAFIGTARASGTPVSFTPPSGWTNKYTVSQLNGTPRYDAHVWYKIATASEPSIYTFTANQTVSYSIVVSAYQGVDTTTPFDVAAYTQDDGVATTVHNTPAITTTGTNRLLVAALMDDGSNPVNAGSGYVSNGNAPLAGTTSTYVFSNTAATVGTYSTTLTGSRTTAVAFPFILALKPAPATNTVTLSDPQPTATSSYTLHTTGTPTTLTKCIRITFDSNAQGSGGKPSGMDVSGASLNASTTYVPTPASWTKTVDAANGVVTFTKTSGETPSASVSDLVIDGIVNPSTAGTSYYVFNSYNDSACSAAVIMSAVYAFSTTNPTVVSVGVDPSFTFSVAGRATACNSQAPSSFTTATSTAVAMGRVTSGTTAGGAQDLTGSSNASGGFTVYLRSTTAGNAMRGTGSASIADVIGTHAAPGAAPTAGAEGFGYTLSDASVGFGANSFAKVTTINEVALAATSVGSKSGCVGYQAAVSGSTPAGNYSTTVIYTAVPAF